MSDYRDSGYDPLAPGALRGSNGRRDAERQVDTFFLSNMAPKQGNGFHCHIWAWIESRARALT